MLCPHCQTEMHPREVSTRSKDVPGNGFILMAQVNRPPKIGRNIHVFRVGYCPACDEGLVMHACFFDNHLNSMSDEPDLDEFSDCVYPPGPNLPPIPPEVPEEYRQDFDEARRVVPISPKSSAALSRRILQMILHTCFNISKRDLQKEIAEFIATINPPSYLADQLDAIRVIGNFAAHPLKSTATGEIQEVESGEAEWLIETLKTLFDFAFVQPEKSAARKDALNVKLAAAGKPPIP